MRSIRSIASLTTPPKRYSMRIDFARRLRTAAALIVLSALVGSSTMSAFAQTVTGTISGFVTSSQENMKLAGVTITAVAPSARYNAKTDQSGFFSINGVTPDTYTLTFAADGYEGFRVSGVTPLMEKNPLWSVFALYRALGATAVIVTPASFIFSWLEVTNPEIVPVTVCANADIVLDPTSAESTISAAAVRSLRAKSMRMLYLLGGVVRDAIERIDRIQALLRAARFDPGSSLATLCRGTCCAAMVMPPR